MNRVFTILCLLLLFFVGRAQNPRVIKQVVVAEYKTWYITQDGKIWSYNNGSALPVQFPIGGLKADTGAGGFNYFRIIDEKGYVWTSKVDNTTHTTRIDNDATGAPFDGNWYIDAYGHAGLTIRADSSVWFFGMDIFSLFHPGGYPYIPMTGANIKPTRLSPVGMKFKKVLFGGSSILGLTTSGQVYQWSNGGSRTPTLIPTPRPATDIFISHLSVAGAIVPDPGEKSGMGYPYIWGFATSMWGGSGPYGSWAKPTSVKALWKMTAPIREISVDWNTIHYIDSLGNMYGSGFNSFGEVGNGEEFINKYNYPGFPGYGWSFTDYENPTGIPVQIGKGVKWKHLYSNNWFGFYKYAMAENDSLYSWGRNKSLALGNGLWNGYAANAAHPDALNVLKPTMEHPLTAILTEYGFIPPSISAGPNQTVAGPVATLKGTARAMLAIAVRRPAPNGIDTAGYKIVSYQWKQVSGPKGATITNPNAATTTVTGLQKGTYVFNLLTTDNNTGTLSANTTVQVTANSSSDQVQANAGPNQTLTLPANSTTLTGTTQTNGTIASYKWTQTSGPSTAAIGTPAKAQTTVSNLIQGVYKFQLQVTTVLGTLAIATVQVTVDPAPVVVGPPVANAGADQTITLPVNNVNLKGSGTETNGTITAYKWSQASGPSNASLATPAQAQTSAGGLVAGTYVFQLTVTDKKGVTASDKVNIVVKAASVDPGKPGPSTPPATTPPPSTPPPPVYLPIPGTIQAEAYSQKKGAGITGPENTSDVGGGKDIGLLKPGDEVSYNVDVAASGAYSMAVRVAPIFDGASFQLQNAAGYVLVTAHLPN
ncbi:MAG TPA: carbohydrate-binding protein, partial [Puia sp.]